MTTYAPVRPRARGVTVDPRMRARRVAVVRAEGRRRLHRVMWVFGALAVGALATGAVMSPLLDVDRIAVAGVDGAHAAEVRAVLGIERGDALLLADTGAATANVEGLTWVDDVRVERRLPGTLRVEVIPRFPVAWRATSQGEVVLLDEHGATITGAQEPPAGLPPIDATGADVADAARIATALPAALRPHVAAVIAREGRVAARLGNGVMIRFGDSGAGRAKVAAALAVLGAIGETPIRYVDVSAPSAPATG